MTTVIVDCYTDEASGLGVPPYLGTYPRYLAGYLNHKGEKYEYITIDDLRLLKIYGNKKKDPKPHEKTNIRIYNTTNKDIEKILDNATRLIVVIGVHVPGKYLSALPGTLPEVVKLIKDIKCEKILTGPAIYGTRLEGGKLPERADMGVFDKVEPFNFTFEEIKEYSVLGADLVNRIPGIRVMEIETGKGCTSAQCSFCTEPLKANISFRKTEDVLEEVKALHDNGMKYFRLGKQTCFYSLPKPGELLQNIRKQCKNIEVLHIDNVNPIFVPTPRGIRLTQDIVKYCTPGNIAAFGVETFDPEVYKANKLNCSAEQAYAAVKIINKYGAERGENGMPKFLPGINIIFGLINESKNTNNHNIEWLSRFLKEKLMIRRINVRKVALFEGTMLYETAGLKFLRKNQKYYWKWRNEIRQKIDNPMLNFIAPNGAILKDVYMEIYDGKTTFGRQFGTYPLIVGVKGRLPLNKFYNITVKARMLRSIVGEVVSSVS